MTEADETNGTWIEPDPYRFVGRDAVPAVFLFQPKFQRLETPEEFKEWERLMAEKVGLPFSAEGSHSKTLSTCGEPGVFDDTDADDPF
jgi:hypothetical protein